MRLRILIIIILLVSFFSCSKKGSSDPMEFSLTPPSDFKAEILGSDTLKLTWSNPVQKDFKEVRIYRSTIKHPSFPEEGELILQGKQESHKDLKLTMGQRYYYSIFAYYADGRFSDKVSINAMPFDLTLPRNLSVIKKVDLIEFHWDLPYDIHYKGIRIIRTLSNQTPSPEEGDLLYEDNSTSFTDGFNPKFPLVCGKNQIYNYFFYSYNESKNYSTQPLKITAFCWTEDSFDINVEIQSPKNMDLFGPKINKIDAIAQTPNASITKAEFYINGTLKQTLSGPGPYSFFYDFSLIPGEGAVQIKIIAYSSQIKSPGVYYSGEKTIDVQFDKTKPSVAILSPLNGSKVEGEVLIKGSASDTMGIKNVDLYIDGTLFQKDLSAPYTYTWKTICKDLDCKSNEGDHTVTLKAYDLAGNENTASIIVQLDNPPFIIKTSPKDLSTGISYTSAITAIFSESLDPSSINDTIFYIEKEDGSKIPGMVLYLDPFRTLVFQPLSSLLPNTQYKAFILNQIKDKNGNFMRNTETWSFKTGNSTNIYDDPGALFDISSFDS